MRNHVFGALALSTAVLVSSLAVAGDRGPSFEEREQAQQSGFQHTRTFGYPGNASGYTRPAGFTILRMNEVGDGEAAAINAQATPANVEALQGSLDPATVAELRAHGVQIRNIIGSRTAFNGRTIYYVQ
jgi:hypothetical protein